MKLFWISSLIVIQAREPNQVQLSVALGQGHQVDFGDMQTCTCPPDQYEEDDTQAQAQPIQVGSAFSQTHDFCDDAVDWLHFSAQAGQVYTITTTSWGQRSDTVLSLYGTDGTTLIVSNDDYDSSDYSSQIVWKAPADGTYYIRVTNRTALNCCATEYDIVVETPQKPSNLILYLPVLTQGLGVKPVEQFQINAPEGVINHICPDPYEVDDSWDQAHAIEIGVLQTHSFDSNPAIYAADKDLVWFDLKRGETVLFTVESITNTHTLLELYDADGLALDVTGTTGLSWTADEQGKYFLSVSPLDDTSFGCANVVGYDLLMDIAPPSIKVIYLPAMFK